MASTFIKLPPSSGGGGGGGAVDSFNARTGIVVSQSGDYSGALISNTPAGTIIATNVQAAVNELNADAVLLASDFAALSVTVAGKQPLDSDLTALAGLSSTGLIARTGAGTVSARTVTGSSNIAVTNGDGVAGNPTVSVTGTIGTSNGGLGSNSTPTNGQIPVGNGTNYVAANITAGAGLSVSNGPGTVQINLATPIDYNIDGGQANSVYGGTTPINGGNA